MFFMGKKVVASGKMFNENILQLTNLFKFKLKMFVEYKWSVEMEHWHMQKMIGIGCHLQHSNQWLGIENTKEDKRTRGVVERDSEISDIYWLYLVERKVSFSLEMERMDGWMGATKGEWEMREYTQYLQVVDFEPILLDSSTSAKIFQLYIKIVFSK